MSKFLDIFEDVTKEGRKIPTTEYKNIGKHPIIDQGQQYISGYTDEEEGLFSDLPAIVFGDHTRVLKYINIPFFLGADGVKLLKSKIKKIDYKYLYYALCNVQIPNTGYNRHYKWLKETNIKIPPLETQHKIAATLDKVTHTIDLCNAILEKLDLLVKSRFVEMFGDFDFALQKPNWIAISQIGTVVGGSTPKTSVPEYWDGEYRWISPAELKADSGIIYDSVKKITKAGVDSCSLQELPIGTVILSSRAPIGKVAITGNTFYCNQGFKNIICNEKILPRYLYTLLLFNTEYLNSLGRGATFKEISKSIVENIRIPLPAIDEQKQFESFVAQVDKSKLAVKQVLEKAETLKKALMQEYFG